VRQQLKRADPKRPLLMYAHFLDPHDPHVANKGSFCRKRMAGQKTNIPEVRAGKSHVLSGEDSLGRRLYFGATPTPVELGPSDLRYLEGLYDCELWTVDRAVGRVVEALRASGRLNRTILVVTADHGEEFLDHGMMRHGYQVYEETVRVPLVIRPPWPLKKPVTVTTPVQHVDLLPTVLSLGGAPYDASQLDGTPINALMPGTPPRQRAFGQTRFRGRDLAYLVRGRHKLIADLKEKRRWLFDLRRDPRERHPLPDDHPLAAKLGKELEQILARGIPEPPLPKPSVKKRKVDPKLKKQLRSLGYIQ
jgi:arylsulfatase A-like enzyme